MRIGSFQQRWRRSGSDSRRRGGVITLEIILVLPILFIVALAMFEFAFLMLVLQAATTALIEGTRKGAAEYPASYVLSLAGSNNDIADQIAEVVNLHLQIHNVEIADIAHGFPDDPDKGNGLLVIERGTGGGSTAQRGALPMGFTCNRTGAAPTSSEIVVTLCFPLVDAGNPTGTGMPVPDWLSAFGISLATYKFEMSSRCSLE